MRPITSMASQKGNDVVRRVSQFSSLAIMFFLLVGCATPIGVKRINEQASYRLLTTSILSTKQPSHFSMQFLQRFALVEQYRKDPPGTIALLHAGLGGPDEHGRLFALSELSFAYAENCNDRARFLAAAIYAYAFLFPEDAARRSSPYDPRLHLAEDLYNRGIANGLRAQKGYEININSREIDLPFTSLTITLNPSGTVYGGYRMTNFVSTDDLLVRGLRNRYRNPGLGAPLAAKVEKTENLAANRWIPPKVKVPVTAVMRFSSPRFAFSDRHCTATIDLYDVDKTPTTSIGAYNSIPLVFDPTATLAYRLEGSPMWDFEIAGFRRSNLNFFKKGLEGELYFLNPYRPGRIPVVFIHGTVSSPARWAEMVNELQADPLIANRYQFWFFMYNSGNPVSLSAMYLRESLERVLSDLDPGRQDPALRKMVVIGHSQGGTVSENDGSRQRQSILGKLQ